MALGKKRIVAHKSNTKNRRETDNGGLGLGLEFVQYKRGFGRKRILISSGDEDEIQDSVFISPASSKKKLCSETPLAPERQNPELEDLPQDIMVRIICGVEHEDLKPLFHVSKPIREATLIAKQLHFAFSTPRKTHCSRFCLDKPFELEDNDEIEAPGAPMQRRYRRSRIDFSKDDSGVAVTLFN